MNVKEIVKAFDNACYLSELLKKPKQTVYYWVKINKIPRWHIPAVKKAARKLGINIEEYLK